MHRVPRHRRRYPESLAWLGRTPRAIQLTSRQAARLHTCIVRAWCNAAGRQHNCTGLPLDQVSSSSQQLPKVLPSMASLAQLATGANVHVAPVAAAAATGTGSPAREVVGLRAGRALPLVSSKSHAACFRQRVRQTVGRGNSGVVCAAGDVSADSTIYLVAGAALVALVGTAFPIFFSRKDL